MAATAADVLAYLDTNMAEVAGTNLFEGGLTETPDAQLAVIHYGGEPADRIMSPSLTASNMEKALVQILSRSDSQTTARERADAAHALLDNLQNLTGASGAKYYLVESVSGEPYFLEQDENQRWVFGAIYKALKTR